MALPRTLTGIALAAVFAAPSGAVAPADLGTAPGDLPTGRVAGTVEARLPSCGSNPPPIPVPGVPVEVLVGGRQFAATTSGPDGSFELAVPGRVPFRIRALLPFDFPLAYDPLVVGEDHRPDLGPVVGTVRFEPGLVAVRFARGTTGWERELILERCRLDPDLTFPDRQLARTRNGTHVSAAIDCLLRFAPRVTGAEPGRYFKGCEPEAAAID